MDIILRNQIVESAKAGDSIIITGCPIVVPDISQLMGGAKRVREEGGGRSKGMSEYSMQFL